MMQQCKETSCDFQGTLTVSSQIRNVEIKHAELCAITWMFVPQVVAAHGICHLLGYRHETDEEWDEVRGLKSSV